MKMTDSQYLMPGHPTPWQNAHHPPTVNVRLTTSYTKRDLGEKNEAE